MSPHVRRRGVEAILLSYIAVTGAIAAYAAIYAVASAPYWDWNAGKLAPMVAFARAQPHHYALYQDPGTGVMTAWIYGPVSAFIFAPAALGDRPTSAIIIAVLINAATVLLPAMWFYTLARRGRRASGADAVALCFLLWICLARESVRQVIFMVMPDGPALGLAVCSCAFLLLRPTPVNLSSFVDVSAGPAAS